MDERTQVVFVARRQHLHQSAAQVQMAIVQTQERLAELEAAAQQIVGQLALLSELQTELENTTQDETGVS